MSFHSLRISRIRSKLTGLDIEAILFFDMKDIRYLTGFTGSDGVLLVEENRVVLMVDGRYVIQAGEEVREAEILEYSNKTEGIVQAAADFGLSVLGFESEAISYAQYLLLKNRLRGVVKLIPISEEINSIRAVKDANEIEMIKKASEISAQAMTSILEMIKPGAIERDIALELEYAMKSKGAEGVSFDTIVAAGKNSALVHARPGMRRIEEGDFVVIDYGAVYGGYHTDETCTYAVGNISERQRKIYAVVKEAHDRAQGAVKSGAACREIDRIARNHIEKEGLARYFPHGTGHGVGLDIHEAPRISDRTEAYLKAGMVITIEPGIYIPGLWGVRIEDTLQVKEDGCEVLTKMPKALEILA